MWDSNYVDKYVGSIERANSHVQGRFIKGRGNIKKNHQESVGIRNNKPSSQMQQAQQT